MVFMKSSEIMKGIYKAWCTHPLVEFFIITKKELADFYE